MTSIVFYFQVHQPFRLRKYRFFDIGKHDDYFDDAENERILRRVAHKCYRPMTDLLQGLVDEHAGAFKCSFSISGTALDQFELWAPDVLERFQRLAETGCVEFLAETSQHSLASLRDPLEFRRQVSDHAARVERLFGQSPRVFRNTELVCSSQIAKAVEDMGFSGILGEGADHVLEWRSPHRVYRPAGCERIKLLLRSYRLSDDIAFRFSNRDWGEWPLSAERFASWLHEIPEHDRFVGLFMDFETFGEHQWEDTGVLDFIRHLPGQVLAHPRFSFDTPTGIVERFEPEAELDMAYPVSWADIERDLTAWLGNDLQRSAEDALYALLPTLRKLQRELRPGATRAEVERLWTSWRRLSTSDHFYYICVKWFSDGDVHKYFSPYDSPYDAFVAYMNVVGDLKRRVAKLAGSTGGDPSAAQAHMSYPN